MSLLQQAGLSRCEKLQQPNYTNLVVSVIILLGLFISYLPQHYRIASRRSSEGISPYFILLGTTSATAGFANILVLPASRADIACCKTVSAFECSAGLLGIAQVGVQWICFSIILVFFLVFFPRNPSFINVTPGRPTWRTAIGVAILCLIHGAIVMVVSVVLLMTRPHQLATWANVLGLMAAGLAAIQYFPQIWTTYNLKHVGSLSIPMMLIQTPGGFVFAGSLFVRLGREGWSTWGVYLVTGTLQGVLLIMGIFYEYEARRKSHANEPVPVVFHPDLDDVAENEEGVRRATTDEQSPLLNKKARKSRRP